MFPEQIVIQLGVGRGNEAGQTIQLVRLGDVSQNGRAASRAQPVDDHGIQSGLHQTGTMVVVRGLPGRRSSAQHRLHIPVNSNFHLIAALVDQVGGVRQTVLKFNEVNERTGRHGDRLHGEGLAAFLRPGSRSALRLNKCFHARQSHIKLSLVAEADTLGVSDLVQPVGIALHDIIHAELDELGDLVLVVGVRIGRKVLDQLVGIRTNFAVQSFVAALSQHNIDNVTISVNFNSHFSSLLS